MLPSPTVEFSVPVLVARHSDLYSRYLSGDDSAMEEASVLMQELACDVAFRDGFQVQFPLYHSGVFSPHLHSLPRVAGDGFHLGTHLAAADRARDVSRDRELDAIVTFCDDKGRHHWKSPSFSSDCDLPSGYGSPLEARNSAKSYISHHAVSLPLTTIVSEFFLFYSSPVTLPDRGASWAFDVTKARNDGFDAILYQNRIEDGGSDSFVALYPHLIKSACPFTCGEDGQLIPLVRRFALSNPSCLY